MKLIAEVFEGEIVARRNIVERIPREHLLRGGVRSRAQNISNVIKKALSRLQAKGLASQVARGYWSILEKEEAPLVLTHPPMHLVDADEPRDGEDLPAIYVYHFSTYYKQAIAQGHSAWPCKVGHTNGDVLDRIQDQTSTALPESPEITMVARTNHARHLEKAIHSILAARSRQIKNSPGKEWFMTSPTQIVEIITWITPDVTPFTAAYS